MSHNIQTKQNGFTLVELMLAMAFLSMLLLAIAVTVLQISSIYTKGASLREVNQTGRLAIDDIRRTFAQSQPISINEESGTRWSTGDSGSICLGSYSYVWNTPQGLGGGTAKPVRFAGDGGTVYLVRVADPGRDMCKSGDGKTVSRSQAKELLNTGDRPLVVHKFDVRENSMSGGSIPGQKMYTVSLRVGTMTGDEVLTGVGACKPPSQTSGWDDYCSVNTFDIIVRAGGGLTEGN